MRGAAAAIATSFLLIPAIAFGSEVQTRVAEAFADLGMEQDQSVCYGSVISEKLDEELGDKAASIIEAAETSEEVRQGVKQSDTKIVRAFLAASNRCGR